MQAHANVADSKKNICIADARVERDYTFPENLSQNLARDRGDMFERVLLSRLAVT